MAQPPPRPPPPDASATHRSSRRSAQPSAQLPAHIETFRDFQRVHDMAYTLVNSGLAADERGDGHAAEKDYQEGFELLDRCLRCELNHASMGSHLDQAKEMQSKLNKTRQQVVFRLRDLQAKHGTATDTVSHMGELQSPVGACALPSYEEAVSSPSAAGHPPAYHEEELTALAESLMRAEADTAPPASATELLGIPDGVQIFFIAPNGLVSAPSYPAALHIVTFDRDERQNSAPPAFLYVGDWVYPLIPGTSPSLHTSYGAYIFPDVTTSQEGSAVGLMLPEVPEVRQQFEDIIGAFTVMGSEVTRQQEEQSSDTATQVKQTSQGEGQEASDTASKISKGILVAADWIAWGVGKGAEKAGELIKAGSERYRRGSKPVEEPRKVDPNVQKGMEYARKATHGAVKVTGFIVNKLGEATVALANQLAPHVRRQGEKVMPRSLKAEDAAGKSKLDGVVKVAASGLQGFGTVFMGLEHAAKSLGKSLTQETVQVVTHKYGDDAGALTENTMYTAGNVALAAYNVDNIGVKAVAKRTAKETGKAVLHDLKNKDQGRPPSPKGGSGGDGRRKQ